MIAMMSTPAWMIASEADEEELSQSEVRIRRTDLFPTPGSSFPSLQVEAAHASLDDSLRS